MFNEEKRFCFHANKSCNVDLNEQNVPVCINPHHTWPTPGVGCYKTELSHIFSDCKRNVEQRFLCPEPFYNIFNAIPVTEKTCSVLAACYLPACCPCYTLLDVQQLSLPPWPTVQFLPTLNMMGLYLTRSISPPTTLAVLCQKLREVCSNVS